MKNEKLAYVFPLRTELANAEHCFFILPSSFFIKITIFVPNINLKNNRYESICIPRTREHNS